MRFVKVSLLLLLLFLPILFLPGLVSAQTYQEALKKQREQERNHRYPNYMFTLYDNPADADCRAIGVLEQKLAKLNSRIQKLDDNQIWTKRNMQSRARSLKKKIEHTNWFCSGSKQLKPNVPGKWD